MNAGEDHGPAPPGRDRLLTAAAQLVRARPIVNGIELLTVGDVAERAEVTSGAVYHYWDSIEDLREELLTDVLDHHQHPHPGYLDQGVERVREGSDRSSASAELAATVLDASERGGLLRLLVALWADPQGCPPELVADSQLRWEEGFEPLVAALLEAHCLRPRPPFDLAGLTRTLLSLATGLRLHERATEVDSRSVLQREPSELACLALTSVLSTAVEHAHGDEVDLASFVTGLLDER